MKAKDQISGAETAAPDPKTPTKHSLDGGIITVHKGIAIYKTHASPFWFARIRDPQAKKYVVRSTKATSRVKAREIAEELAHEVLSAVKKIPKEYSFKYYATRFIEKGRRLVATANRTTAWNFTGCRF